MANETQKPTLTTAFGRPVEDNQHSLTAGPRGPDPAAGLSPHGKDGPLQPGARAGAGCPRQGLRRLRHIPCHQGHHAVHLRQDLQLGRQGNRDVRPLLHRGRRERIGRHRPRPARLRVEVLHRRRQLGSGRQQHADLLHPRSAEVQRLHPHPEARSGHPSEAALAPLGLLGSVARGRSIRSCSSTATVARRYPPAS